MSAGGDKVEFPTTILKKGRLADEKLWDTAQRRPEGAGRGQVFAEGLGPCKKVYSRSALSSRRNFAGSQSVEFRHVSMGDRKREKAITQSDVRNVRGSKTNYGSRDAAQTGENG